ncbi:caskin-1-like [Zingiber officinale]|uniref:PB1 domain-containing protein n=1 Tax=Zingiber officinale TaxID=94328 RepID=A0A8J5KWN8_ZINOF|nr:caskin-1-like [Zingiber officinale]KAG6499044.1 hypothetical protein ZIOFF_038800 [Zingiber officinale]
MDAASADSSLSLVVDNVAVVSAASDDARPPSPATSPGAGSRVKLMVSYGGRIQPRPHDNTRLAYVGGETKILALDRSARLLALLAKLAAVAPTAPDPVCIKYQIPGEDLDALVSVTDDDDLEHMMIEYDRILRAASSTSPRTSARLRLFLFPVGPPPPPPSAALLDASNTVPVRPPSRQPSPSPDFLFGFDDGFVPPPAVKVAVDPPPPTIVLEDQPTEAPAKSDPDKDEPNLRIKVSAEPVATAQAVVTVAETERHVYPKNLPPLIPRNTSQDALPLVHPSDFRVPSPPHWPDTVGRFPSLSPGIDQTGYLLQATPGMYPGFFPTPPRMTANAVGGGAEAYAGGGKLAYDSAGRLVYCTPVVPSYRTVTSVALKPVESTVTASRPPQIA